MTESSQIEAANDGEGKTMKKKTKGKKKQDETSIQEPEIDLDKVFDDMIVVGGIPWDLMQSDPMFDYAQFMVSIAVLKPAIYVR